MAISQEDILARIQQIQSAGGGDTAATRAQIAQEAQQYGVTPEQLGRATGLLGSQVRTMAEEAGQAFAPMQMTGGMLGGSNIDVTTPVTPMTTQTGMLEGVTVDTTPKAYTPQATSQSIPKAYEGDQSAMADLLLSAYTQGGDTKALRPLLEDITTKATGNKGTDPAYNFLVGSTAEAALRNEYNSAIANGDFVKAQEIDRAIKQGGEAPLRYYESQYGEGTAHTLTQDLFNDPFKIGAPGKYQTSFFEKIGDVVSDTIQDPFVQAAAAFIPGVGPAVSSVMQAWGTLDSGDNLSPTQIVAALAGVSELSGLEGGNLIKMLPKELQETATAFQKALEGGWDEVASAFKNAGLDATSEQFAAFEDGLKAVLGEENVQAFSEGLAGIDDGVRELFEGQFGGVDSRLGSIEETLALLEQASLNRGGGFTPQRGYQPGLAVDTEFGGEEPSSVLAMLNTPSSVQQRP